MKRSEMTLILRHWVQHCIHLTKNNQMTSNKVDEVANEILLAIEDSGMLPPKDTYSSGIAFFSTSTGGYELGYCGKWDKE